MGEPFHLFVFIIGALPFETFVLQAPSCRWQVFLSYDFQTRYRKHSRPLICHINTSIQNKGVSLQDPSETISNIHPFLSKTLFH